MRTPAEEPSFAPWAQLTDDELLRQMHAASSDRDRRLVLVDGRSAGGKTTFASRLGGIMGADVVHTDDVAWHHDYFDWADLLATNVIEPWRQGRDVDYRPPGWVSKGREGSVRCRAARHLVVEGVGCARPELAALADVVVWCQSDFGEAERRGLERDVRLGRSPAEARAFWDEWMAVENGFQARSRPWERAHLVVVTTSDAAGLGECRDLTFSAPGPAAVGETGREYAGRD